MRLAVVIAALALMIPLAAARPAAESGDDRGTTHVKIHILYAASKGRSAPAVTDCASGAYKLLSGGGPRLRGSATLLVNSGASGVGSATSAFGSAAATWNAATAGADPFASVGSTSLAGAANDGTNIAYWTDLSSGVIAQTYVFYNSATKTISGFDIQMNTDFDWSLTGEAGQMDVENIAAHELGHDLGLGHPSSSGRNACLTMYAYASYGETSKRTLGDGDLLGAQRLYG